jgi:hypothetical protein
MSSKHVVSLKAKAELKAELEKIESKLLKNTELFFRVSAQVDAKLKEAGKATEEKKQVLVASAEAYKAKLLELKEREDRLLKEMDAMNTLAVTVGEQAAKVGELAATVSEQAAEVDEAKAIVGKQATEVGMKFDSMAEMERRTLDARLRISEDRQNVDASKRMVNGDKVLAQKAASESGTALVEVKKAEATVVQKAASVDEKAANIDEKAATVNKQAAIVEQLQMRMQYTALLQSEASLEHNEAELLKTSQLTTEGLAKVKVSLKHRKVEISKCIAKIKAAGADAMLKEVEDEINGIFSPPAVSKASSRCPATPEEKPAAERSATPTVLAHKDELE